MADKIDQLIYKNSSGTNVAYDIDLPPDATPSIVSLTASGNIEGGAIKKTGGTSSQFLKADGSTDSTSYLPLSAGSSKALTGDLYTGGNDIFFNQSNSIGNNSGGGLVIDTGSSLTLSAEDSISISSDDNIALGSGGDIGINAAGSISIEAPTSIYMESNGGDFGIVSDGDTNISSGSDLNTEAINIYIEADEKVGISTTDYEISLTSGNDEIYLSACDYVGVKGNGTYYACFATTHLTANKSYEFPNEGGTLALTKNLPQVKRYI